MKITILAGSVRKERQSFGLASYLQVQLQKRGIQVGLIDLAKTPLPIFGQEGSDQSNVKSIGDQLRQSNALILVTPEYHGSFSGVLKNALDYYWEEFQKKPIGVAAASAGKMAGINASTQLQHVVLSLGAYPVPRKLLVSEIHKAFNSNYLPLNNSLSEAVEKFLDEFLWFSEAMTAKKMKAEKVV